MTTSDGQTPKILELPIGLGDTGLWQEFDSLGKVEVPANRYWSAQLRDAIDAKSKQWADVVKIGRTHLEDATPLTVGQEWSGYAGALDDAITELEHVTAGLLALAIGGTAVGTGLNAPAGFGDQVAAQIARMTGAPLKSAANKFAAHGTLDRMVRAHGGLKEVAVTLFKVANDLRWLGSGPRTGIQELIFPSNEPGSSIMPGKVNPTQAEAMLMVAMQVIASDVAVTMGGAEGNFELNAFRPAFSPSAPLQVRLNALAQHLGSFDRVDPGTWAGRADPRC